jgi:hypothetical protein
MNALFQKGISSAGVDIPFRNGAFIFQFFNAEEQFV